MGARVKNILGIAAIVAVMIAFRMCAMPGSWKGPDSPQLTLFKASLQSPSPVQNIVFTEIYPKITNRYEGFWGPDNYRITLKNAFGTRDYGVFQGLPWNHSSNALETLEFYPEWPPAMKQMFTETGGSLLGEQKLKEVLSGGILVAKPGSLVWAGHRFTARAQGKYSIEGKIWDFNKAGLPRRLSYGIPGNWTLTFRFEYGGADVPDYFPSAIRRDISWTDSILRGYPKLSSFEIQKLEFGVEERAPEAVDPIKRFPNATRLYFTNAQWMQLQGTNMIPVSGGDAKP